MDVHREVCIQRNTTHGLSRTRTHRIWCALGKRRYETGPVCARWDSFENFLADMGEPPTAKHTIDRKDNAKGYEPSNCRWATMKEQQNNRTNNRLLTHQGRTQTLAQWSAETGFKPATLSMRLNQYGWTVERALTAPVSYYHGAANQ